MKNLRIHNQRLLDQINAREGDGVCRLALTVEDEAGWDKVLE